MTGRAAAQLEDVSFAALRRQALGAPLAPKIEAESAAMLGTPYKLGPMGEGPDGEYDRGPLEDEREVDCTTYVEQVLARALAPSAAGVPDVLRRIRYKDGVIRYENRNHFTEADWIPNNVAAGFLRDITRRIAGSRTKVAVKTVSKSAWYAAKTAAQLRGFDGETPVQREARAARWRALGAGLPDETVALPYLPIEDLPALLWRIPSGTVVNLVREPQAGKPTMISHQFFIVDGPSGKMVRHAAFGKDVRDVPALAYFKVYEGSSWPLLGLNLDEALAP